jgi:hypothetical protein
MYGAEGYLNKYLHETIDNDDNNFEGFSALLHDV